MRCMAPSGLSTAAQSAQARIGIGQMMQNSGADDLIEASPQLAGALDWGAGWTSRLCKLYFCLSSSVQRTLVALKSMPVTRAAGQRKAYLAACDVPQPATRMEKSSR